VTVEINYTDIRENMYIYSDRGSYFFALLGKYEKKLET